jgi:hypothetical protein
MYSDNGTNFVGAANHLEDLYALLTNSEETIKNFFRNKQVTWKFICPRAPQQGGLWEAGVKLMKTHLKAAVGKTILSFEKLQTICCQVEAMLNSRPLTYVNDDPSDMEPITPAHFLIFRPMNAMPEREMPEKIIPDAYLYDRMVQIQQGFWNRWHREYLSQLQQRNKNFRHKVDYKIGQLVLICDRDGLPPLQWPLGRITEVIKGKDELIRMVKAVDSHGKEYFRPITKIAVLPISDNTIRSALQTSSSTHNATQPNTKHDFITNAQMH